MDKLQNIIKQIENHPIFAIMNYDTFQYKLFGLFISLLFVFSINLTNIFLHMISFGYMLYTIREFSRLYFDTTKSNDKLIDIFIMFIIIVGTGWFYRILRFFDIALINIGVNIYVLYMLVNYYKFFSLNNSMEIFDVNILNNVGKDDLDVSQKTLLFICKIYCANIAIFDMILYNYSYSLGTIVSLICVSLEWLWNLRYNMISNKKLD